MGTEGTPDDDGSSLAASVVEYVEKASLTDTRVSELEARLAAFEMGANGQQQQQYGPIPSQAMYYMPEYSYMAPQQHQPPPTHIQFNEKSRRGHTTEAPSRHNDNKQRQTSSTPSNNKEDGQEMDASHAGEETGETTRRTPTRSKHT